MNRKLAVSEKYALSINEASQYFGIGIKKMRRLAEDNLGTISVLSGNRYLIIRAEFEEYLRKNPTMQKAGAEELKKAQLEHKSIFNTEEAIEFYGLSRRKFKRLLEEEEGLPFIAYFRKRKLIVRDEFEKYMGENPEIMEGLKNGKARIS